MKSLSASSINRIPLIMIAILLNGSYSSLKSMSVNQLMKSSDKTRPTVSNLYAIEARSALLDVHLALLIHKKSNFKKKMKRLKRRLTIEKIDELDSDLEAFEQELSVLARQQTEAYRDFNSLTIRFNSGNTIH